MLAKHRIPGLQVAWLLALMMITAIAVSPAYAAGVHQEVTDQPIMAFDGSLVNEYMAECQSVAAGSPVSCMDYAFSLAGVDTLAAMPVHLEQFALNVAEVDAFDGSLVNEYMAECQSVIAGSVVECMDYAVELAAPFAE